MAKTFRRYPVIGGDLNSWAPYNDYQNDISLGVITSKLYDSSGTLYISTGKIGFDDGDYKGLIDITSAESISLSGLTTSNWALIETYFSGAVPTFGIASISGASDENEVPTNFTNAYDPVKGGYYVLSTRRALGVVWIDGSGNLGKVISALSFDNFAGEDVRSQNGFIKKNNYAKFSYTVASGNNGGATVLTTWTILPLNTTDHNYIKSCVLNTNTISLPVGIFKIKSFCLFSDLTVANVTRLRDTTNNVTLAVSNRAGVGGTNDLGISIMEDVIITVASAITVEFQYFSYAAIAQGLGGAEASSGENTVFRWVSIEKIDGE